MPIESATYINELNPAYPQAGDDPRVGDDHFRLIKDVLVTTCPNIGGAITATHTELNYVDGVTSAIQTQLDNRARVYLSGATASASAAIDFTSGIDSTYGMYELHIVNAVPTSGGLFLLQTSSNGGSSWDSGSGDYDWTIGRATSGGITGTSGSTTATSIAISSFSANVTSTTAWGGYCAVIRIYNPSGTTHHKRFSWQSDAATSTTNGNIQVSFGAGTRAATAAINAIRITNSGGQIASGRFALYGVKTA
jgi:hypothetical protein